MKLNGFQLKFRQTLFMLYLVLNALSDQSAKTETINEFLLLNSNDSQNIYKCVGGW